MNHHKKFQLKKNHLIHGENNNTYTSQARRSTIKSVFIPMSFLTNEGTVGDFLATTAILQFDLLDKTGSAHIQWRGFHIWIIQIEDGITWNFVTIMIWFQEKFPNFIRYGIAKKIGLLCGERCDESGHPWTDFTTRYVLGLPNAASHFSRIDTKCVSKQLNFLEWGRANSADWSRNALGTDAMKIYLVLRWV